MKDLIVFQHPYYKLAEPEFSTIRGKSWFPRLRKGALVGLRMPGRPDLLGCVVGLKLATIHSLPLDFLKRDCAYPGFEIHSHEGFVNFINTFRRPGWPQATVDSVVTVIQVRRIET